MEYISITILVPKKDINLPDSHVTTFPRVQGEPIDQYAESGEPEIIGLDYAIDGWDEEAIDDLVLDRWNEEH